jgi:hypothetical protein
LEQPNDQHTEQPLLAAKKPHWSIRFGGWLLRKIKRWTVGLLRFLILLWFIFKIPFVQNWLAQQAAAFLSQQLGARVEVGAVEIELFNKAILHDVFVSDQRGDTLLHAQELRAYIDLVSILDRQVNVNRIELHEAYLNYQRREGEQDFNLYFILRFLNGTPNPNKKKSTPLKLSITEARLINTRVHYLDAAIGTEVDIWAKHGYIYAPSDSTHIPLKFIRADSVFLDSARVDIRKFRATPLPPKPMAVSKNSNPQPNWDIKAARLRTRGVEVNLRNEIFPISLDRTLDFNDLRLRSLDIAVANFSMFNEAMEGDVKALSMQEKRGFKVLSLHGHVQVTPKRVAISDFRLRTPYSDIGDLLTFDYDTYRDFFDFVNKVEMRAELHNSTVCLRDIMAFAHTLQRIPFFQTNANRPMQVSGSVHGTINNLKVRNIDIRTAQQTVVRGNMSLNDITSNDAGFMDLQFDELQTNYGDLKQLISFVPLPIHIDRMGLMRFNGNYTGYFKEFVAFGRLQTSIGTASTDLKMNLRQGSAKASYSGKIRFDDFDLAKLLNNSNFGKMSLHTDLNGQGLTAETLNALFQGGQVDSFVFRDYVYRNVSIDGRLQNRHFDGRMQSRDKNCEFNFVGIADLRDSLPKIDLRGRIGYINFNRLNILDEFATLKIDTFWINATGDQLTDLKGAAYFDDVSVSRFGRHFFLDSIYVVSEDSMRYRTRRIPNDSTRRDTLGLERRNYIKVFSDVGSLRLAGAYDVKNLPRALARYINSYYPNLFNSLAKIEALNMANLILVDSLNPLVPQRLRLQINIDTTHNITQLIDTNLAYISGVQMRAYFNSLDDTLDLRTTIKAVKYTNITVKDVHINGGAIRENLFLHNDFATLQIGDSTRLPAFNFDLLAKGDTLKFNTKLSEIGKVASDINLSGQLSFASRILEINLDTAHVVLLGHPWDIRGNNYIRIGANKLEVQNVRFTNENQLIEISNLGSRGIAVCVEKMNLKWLYDLVKIPQIDLGGTFSADFRIRDVFKQHGLSANFLFDSLFVNGDRWGRSRLLVRADSIQDTIFANFTHNSPYIKSLVAEANFLPFFATKDAAKKNTFNVSYNIDEAKAYILQYFLSGVVSETSGIINVRSGRVFGQAGKKINTTGTGYVYGFGTKVNFLNTSYQLDSSLILISNEGFNIAPYTQMPIPMIPTFGIDVAVQQTATIRDQRGQPAQIWGGIRHQNLKNFELDLHFRLKNNLVLNTSKKDNTTFYGRVHADGLVNFTGPFNQLRLVVDDAVTRDSSNLVLPLDDPLEVQEVKFVTFVDKVEQRRQDSILLAEKLQGIAQAKKSKNNNTGFSIEINTKITPVASVQMIFDERTGEIMEGRGEGFLRITFNTAGEFGMFGDFTITEGSYLFTYQNLINKNFTVKKGGTIVWTGDPYEAQLDIQAEYKQNTSLYNLISAYLETADDATRRLANKPTEVSLLMNVRGLLFSPEITFDISVPDAPPQLRSFTDLALKAIRNNTSELNRQVFGLVALQQFVPLENAGGSGQGFDIVSTSVNTLSELVARQLSSYLTDLLKGVVDEIGFISSFEVDVNLNMREQSTTSLGSNRNSNLNVGLDQTLFDNRLRVRVGANLDLGSNATGNVSGTNQNYIGSDFVVEYRITEDGRLKLRGYNRTETNILGRVTRSGIGISYRKDFNSFGELVSDIQKNMKSRKTRRKIRQAAKKAQKMENEPIIPTEEENINIIPPIQ